MEPDKYCVIADSCDTICIWVYPEDHQGEAIPNADNELSFAIKGSGYILGVGNGDPGCHEPNILEPWTLNIVLKILLKKYWQTFHW